MTKQTVSLMPERAYPRQDIFVRYAGTEAWLTAQHVHTWKRDDAELQHGTDKDTMKARAALILEQSGASRATMLVLNRMPFFVVHLNGGHFDLSVPEPRRVELRKSSP